MKATDRGWKIGDILHLYLRTRFIGRRAFSQDDQGVHGADLALGVDQEGIDIYFGDIRGGQTQTGQSGNGRDEPAAVG